MKKRWFGIFIISLILLINLVFASQIAEIKATGKDYKFELISIDQEKAILKINNVTKILRKVQSSPPYTLESIDSMPELKYVLTDLHYSTYLGDVKYVNLFVLFEKNISSGTKKTFSFNGRDYNVELVSAVSVSEAILRINNKNETTSFNKVQSSPPYYIDSIALMSDLKYIITSIRPAASINILLGFELNLFIECIENWSCSEWGSCINSQQTRICNDINSCGSEKNKPSLNQSCINTTIFQTSNQSSFQPGCINECNISGAKNCFNNTFYKTCGNYDSDNCTEWSNPVSCSNSTVKKDCKNNGECVIINEKKDILIFWIFGETMLIIVILIVVLIILGKKRKNNIG